MFNSTLIKGYFNLGSQFASIKASKEMSDYGKTRQFDDFVSLCKELEIKQPEDYDEVMDLESYVVHFSNELTGVKQDIFQFGYLSFKLFTPLYMSYEKQFENKVEDPNDDFKVKLSSINEEIILIQNKLIISAKDYQFDTIVFEEYFKELKTEPHTAIQNFIQKFAPILIKIEEIS